MQFRIAQIVEWDRSGQSCIALLCGTEIIGRFFDYTQARAALKVARESGHSLPGHTRPLGWLENAARSGFTDGDQS